MLVKDVQMEPKELPLMTMENPLTEDKISKIVSNMKKNKIAGLLKVFAEMVKHLPKLLTKQ